MTVSVVCGGQNYLSRKSTQFVDNMKRTRSASKLDNKKPDAVVGNDDRWLVAYILLLFLLTL